MLGRESARGAVHPPDVISVHTISQTSEDSDHTTEEPSSPEVVASAEVNPKPHAVSHPKAERRPSAALPERNQDDVGSERSIPGMGESDRKRLPVGKAHTHASQNSKNRKIRKGNVDGGRVRRRAVFVDGVSYHYVQRTVSKCEAWMRMRDSRVRISYLWRYCARLFCNCARACGIHVHATYACRILYA